MLTSAPSPRRHPPGARFWALLGSATVLLVVLVIGAFLFPPGWGWTVGLVYIAYDTWLLGTMVRASRRAIRTERPPSRVAALVGQRPSLAVLISARNEAAMLPATLEALGRQTDAPEEIWIIDDGSTDDTLGVLDAAWSFQWDGARRVATSRRDPRLRLLRKAGSGKARSLNEGLARIGTEVVVTLDADTLPEPEAVAALRFAFASEPALVAACGVLRPLTAGKGAVARAFGLYQRFEYLRAFLWRLAWMEQRTLVLVSGAFAAFRRRAVLEVGGFDPTSQVEDYELLFRLHRRALAGGAPPEVRVVSGARATTDVPSGPAAFLRQRRRWFAGFLDTMVRNRDLVAEPRHGRLGSFHLVVKTLDMVLPLYALAANSAFLVFLLLGRRLPPAVLAVLAAKFLYDLGAHAWCLALHERWQGRRLRPALLVQGLLSSVTEPFLFQLYRQLGAFLGWVSYLRGHIDWAPRALPRRPLRGREVALGALLLALLLPAGARGATLEEGLALKKQGKLAEAAAVFRALVEQNGSDLEALEQWATVLGWEQRYDEAIAAWTRAMETQPAAVRFRVGRARVRYWKGELEGAWADLQEALRATPASVDALVLAGDVALARGDRSEARSLYRQALKLDPAAEGVGTKLARAADPPAWRLDVGGNLDRYDNFRSTEGGGFVQLSLRAAPTFTVTGGYEVIHQFGKTDHRFNGGFYWVPWKPLLLTFRGAVAPNRATIALWQVEGGAEAKALPWLDVLFGYRHLYFPGTTINDSTGGTRIDQSPEHVNIYVPGFRFRLSPVWTLTLQGGAATSTGQDTTTVFGRPPISTDTVTVKNVPTTGFGLARLDVRVSEPVTLYLAGSYGNESKRPQPPATGFTAGSGVLWNIDPTWGVRLDYLFERRDESEPGRNDAYSHHSIASALTVRF